MIVYFFEFGNIVNYVNRFFPSVQASLYSWHKCHFDMVFFLNIQSMNDLFRIFTSVFIRDLFMIFQFQNLVLFWYQNKLCCFPSLDFSQWSL